MQEHPTKKVRRQEQAAGGSGGEEPAAGGSGGEEQADFKFARIELEDGRFAAIWMLQSISTAALQPRCRGAGANGA